MRSTNYPIGDFLSRIKNAALAKKREVEVDSTKLIAAVAKVLKKEGFLSEIKKDKNKLKVKVAYMRKEPVLIDLKLVSKPGLRIYMGAKELEAIRGPFFFILSTPDGIMTTREAIKKRVGGEVIVKIW